MDAIPLLSMAMAFISNIPVEGGFQQDVGCSSNEEASRSVHIRKHIIHQKLYLSDDAIFIIRIRHKGDRIVSVVYKSAVVFRRKKCHRRHFGWNHH